MSTLTESQLQDISNIMAQYGVPDYVWMAVMQQESGGDPTKHVDNANENSWGLFQINTKGNPSLASYGSALLDPIVNATVAARYFLGPHYAEAQRMNMNDPADIAGYVEARHRIGGGNTQAALAQSKNPAFVGVARQTAQELYGKQNPIQTFFDNLNTKMGSAIHDTTKQAVESATGGAVTMDVTGQPKILDLPKLLMGLAGIAALVIGVVLMWRGLGETERGNEGANN